MKYPIYLGRKLEKDVGERVNIILYGERWRWLSGRKWLSGRRFKGFSATLSVFLFGTILAKDGGKRNKLKNK